MANNSTARSIGTNDAAANVHTIARVKAGTFAVGDRVLDVPSGFQGTVTGVGLLDALRRNDVRVELDGGHVVVRSPDSLVFRPALPITLEG